MIEVTICLDAGVWVKFLVREEPPALSVAGATLVLRALTTARLVAPAFAWAEVGSVLRKKVRQGILTAAEADATWRKFGRLPIEFVDSPVLHVRAWEIAERYALPTLYDAAFLACTDLAGISGAVCEFWTADEQLLRALGAHRPPYVRQLGVDV